MAIRPVTWWHDDETGQVFAIIPRPDGTGDDRVDGDVVARLPIISDAVNTVGLEVEGVAPGAPWRQPEGAHNAYPRGFQVSYGGKTWESLVTANAHAPGVSGWREIVTGGGAPAWQQPTGAHDAYQTGDRVTFQGKTYESVINGNVWSPAAHPAGWKVVTG